MSASSQAVFQRKMAILIVFGINNVGDRIHPLETSSTSRNRSR